MKRLHRIAVAEASRTIWLVARGYLPVSALRFSPTNVCMHRLGLQLARMYYLLIVFTAVKCSRACGGGSLAWGGTGGGRGWKSTGSFCRSSQHERRSDPRSAQAPDTLSMYKLTFYMSPQGCLWQNNCSRHGALAVV